MGPSGTDLDALFFQRKVAPDYVFVCSKVSWRLTEQHVPRHWTESQARMCVSASSYYSMPWVSPENFYLFRIFNFCVVVL